MAIKTETLTIKVSPEEKEQIKALAAEADITVSKYLYRMLFPAVAVNKEEYLDRIKDYISDSEYKDLYKGELMVIFNNIVKGV